MEIIIAEALKGAVLTDKLREERIQVYYEMLRKLKHCRQNDLHYMGFDTELIAETIGRWNDYLRRSQPINGESPVHEAWRRVMIEGMGVDERLSIIVKETDSVLVYHSYNFCPILDACEMLNLDTRSICRDIFEPAMRELAMMIHPQLRFKRNYKNIRPYCNFCEEMFFIP